jgi:hypothetical protein
MTTETLDEQARIAFEDIVNAVKGGNCNLFLGLFYQEGNSNIPKVHE